MRQRSIGWGAFPDAAIRGPVFDCRAARFADEQEEGTHADHDHDARMTNERISVRFDQKGFVNHGLT
jgi:hypothetical protein